MERVRFSAEVELILTMSEVTRVLQAMEKGDQDASEELLSLVYDDLRRHAAVRMARESPGQTLQPTALVHEAWLRMVGTGSGTWANRAHFFGAAAEAMRRILIENARRKSRLKRWGSQSRVDLEGIDLAAATPEDRILMIDDAVEQLRVEDPEKARVVVLKFFGGHSNREIAEMTGVAERTIERHWAYAKAWLYQHMRAEA